MQLRRCNCRNQRLRGQVRRRIVWRELPARCFEKRRPLDGWNRRWLRAGRPLRQHSKIAAIGDRNRCVHARWHSLGQTDALTERDPLERKAL